MWLDIKCNDCFRKMGVAQTAYKPMYFEGLKVTEIKHFCLDCITKHSKRGK